MDRLVCGDVGFGKTEVAEWRSWRRVHGGRQVVILAATTCSPSSIWCPSPTASGDRPVKRSRCCAIPRSAKEMKARSRALAEGRDRHRRRHAPAAAEKVKFSRPGLVVIDEEHRFGVRRQGSLKAMRAEVDVLTLTATPIPRTLNMALGACATCR